MLELGALLWVTGNDEAEADVRAAVVLGVAGSGSA